MMRVKASLRQIRTAADLVKDDCDRAMGLAHKLSMELRASEDRTHQMVAEVEHWRDRATRAEQWLRTIQQETEEKLLTREIVLRGRQHLPATRSPTPGMTSSWSREGVGVPGALTKLSPDHREIIDLIYYHAKSVDDAAEILSIPRATVRPACFMPAKSWPSWSRRHKATEPITSSPD